jgi:hypothetical protein
MNAVSVGDAQNSVSKVYERTLILHDDLDAFLKGPPSLDQTSGASAQKQPAK